LSDVCNRPEVNQSIRTSQVYIEPGRAGNRNVN